MRARMCRRRPVSSWRISWSMVVDSGLRRNDVSGFDHASVGSADGVPCSSECSFFEGELGGHFFVDVDAEAWFSVWPHHSVSDFGEAGEHLAGVGSGDGIFLDSEVVAVDVEHEVCGVSDW